MKYRVYSLCFLMFNSFSLLAMVPTNPQIVSSNGTTPHGSINSLTGLPLPANNNRMEYVIDIFEQQNNSIDKIRDKIDEHHLGIDRNVWFRGIRGACNSFYKSNYLTDEQVINEMNIIQSYIPEENKELVLEKLETKHWYVNYLFQALVHKKIEEIKKVKGSTVDVLYNPTTQEGFKKMVHTRALQEYFDDSRIKKSLFNDVPMGKLGDIHWAVLYGHKQDIGPTSLRMSCDGKHLQSSGDDSTKIIWDMERGIKTNLSGKEVELDNIQWTKAQYAGLGRYCVVDETDNYFAETFTPLVKAGENNPPSNMAELYGPSKMPVIIEKNEPAILLFKRPKTVSYLCQQAFYNSKDDREELTALHNSKSFDAIEGFPQNNLQQRIEKRIQELVSKL